MGYSAGYVYILHFRTAIAGGRKYSQHYVGWSGNWILRIRAHRRGEGSTLCRVAVDRGIHIDVAIVTTRYNQLQGRELERYIKRQRHHARYCPMCGSRKLTDYRD